MTQEPSSSDVTVEVLPTPADAADFAARMIAEVLRRSGPTHLLLAGGTTPHAAYGRLAHLVADWSSVHLWFGDERHVPPDHPDANAAMVAKSLIAKINIPRANLHLVPTQRALADAAASYANELADAVVHDAHGIPVLDVVLLGLGEDGHVASLFPYSPGLASDAPNAIPVNDAPKPPPSRVSVSLPVINAATTRIVLAAGAGKAAAVVASLGPPDPALPASMLRRAGTTYILDAAAAADLATSGATTATRRRPLAPRDNRTATSLALFVRSTSRMRPPAFTVWTRR